MPKEKREPRYIQLKNELTKIIEDENLQAHDKFLSQPTVINRYSVTITTARKTFDAMESEGLIYRVHGKGTFIAPKSNTYTILVVSNYNSQIRERHFSYMGFWAGIQDYLDRNSSIYYPTSINSEKFLTQLNDLEVYYKNIKGVLFFRNKDSYLSSREILQGKGIPTYFYGSDTYSSDLDENRLLYNEKEIVELALNNIIERGYKNFGVYYNSNNPVRLERCTYFINALKERGLSISDDMIICQSKTSNNELKERLLSCSSRTGFFCVDDWLGAELLNTAVSSGKSIPEEIGVISINNFPFCSLMIKPLSSIDIPVFDDGIQCYRSLIRTIESAEVKSNRSKVSFINRASL